MPTVVHWHTSSHVSVVAHAAAGGAEAAAVGGRRIEAVQAGVAAEPAGAAQPRGGAAGPHVGVQRNRRPTLCMAQREWMVNKQLQHPANIVQMRKQNDIQDAGE